MKTKTETWHGPAMAAPSLSSSEGKGVNAEENGIPIPFRPEGKIHIHYPKELKFHVTLEALREKIPQNELGAIYGVPQSLVSIWKKAAVDAVRSNIHYKQRKRGEALGLISDPLTEDAFIPIPPAEIARHLCELLRAAARQIERNPAILQQLVGQELAD